VLEKPGGPRSAQDAAAIRQVASQLVSQLFFAPLLAEIRRFPFGRQIGHGGRGEEVFGEQLDLRVADAVAGAAGGALKERIERELGPEQVPAAQSGARSAAPPGNEERSGWKDSAARSGLAALPAGWPVLLQVRQTRRTP
jgi:hypothetical protein